MIDRYGSERCNDCTKNPEIRANLNRHENAFRQTNNRADEPTRPGSSETSRRHPISRANYGDTCNNTQLLL